MKIRAFAKINLGLDVIRRREDGYHEVRMIMQTIGLGDELVIERIDDPCIRITVSRDDLPVNEDNLIHKAAKLMMDEYDLPGGISVDLTKNIPVAAGLAGGSTDAAAVLKAVNELYGLGITRDRLMELGVRIGADVPYCVMGGTCLAEGIGEILTPLPACPEWTVVLAKPPVGVSTAHVYKSLDINNVIHPDIDKIAEGIKKADFAAVTGNMGNVLESVTVSEIPYIGYIKKIMADHEGFPLMSGSGPTVFGLFASDAKAREAYEELDRADYVSELFITGITDGRA